jgi:hypothetical protein
MLPLTVFDMKIAVFWEVKQCNLVDKFQRFGDIISFHLQGRNYPENGGSSFF